MAGESRRAGRILEIVHLRIYRSLESCKFLFGEHQEEGFKEHDGFAQAGVQIIVRSVHRLPVREGFGRSAGAKILGGLAKMLAQIDDHLLERADFVEKLRILGVPVLVLVIVSAGQKTTLDPGPMRAEPERFVVLEAGRIEDGLAVLSSL